MFLKVPIKMLKSQKM